MTRLGIAEIVPSKLYQRGEFRNWPVATKRRILAERGITIVINLWGKVDPDLEGYQYHVWPELRSNTFPSALWTFVDVGLAPLLREPQQIALVHCEAGRGRSVAVCAALVTQLLNMSGSQALAYVYERVPNATVHPILQATIRARYDPITTPAGSPAPAAGSLLAPGSVQWQS